MFKKNFAIYCLLLSVFFKTSFQTKRELAQDAPKEDKSIQESQPGMMNNLSNHLTNGVGYLANGTKDAFVGTGNYIKGSFNSFRDYLGFGEKTNDANVDDVQKLENNVVRRNLVI